MFQPLALVILIQQSVSQFPGTEIRDGSSFVADETYEYEDDEIFCIDNIDCIVICGSHAACFYTTIYGPSNASLTIRCDANYYNPGFNPSNPKNQFYTDSCYVMTVHAENSTALYINVANNYRSELRESDIYTPITNEINTYITCGIIGTNSYLEPTDSFSSREPVSLCLTDNNIYSRYGFNTVIWTYYDNSSWAMDGAQSTMHCFDEKFWLIFIFVFKLDSRRSCF